jgi:hypothetical protein
MKIQCASICICYSDYLECVVANRKHFDRWVIISARNDSATRALCRQFGLQFLQSAALNDDGTDFDAAYNKSAAINEALTLFDQNEWALVLDSDVLLPRDFRSRLESLPLDHAALYGLAGRKICHSRAAFSILRNREPWTRFVGRNSQPVGYFNLFHLSGKINRYPTLPRRTAGVHDDHFFTTSFRRSARKSLPFTALHVGPIGENWHKRQSKQYSKTNLGEAASSNSHLRFRGSTAVVLGFFPHGRWRSLTKEFEHVYLVDHYGIQSRNPNAVLEADYNYLRGLMGRHLADSRRYTMIGPHEESIIGSIGANTVDLFYIAGELAPEWFVESWELWRRKLRKNAIVCGDFFGLPDWPEASQTIVLLLGRPEEVMKDGFWWGRHRRHQTNPSISGRSDKSIRFVNTGIGTVNQMILALIFARMHWSGLIELYHWGPESPPLLIFCSLFRISFHHVEWLSKTESSCVSAAVQSSASAQTIVATSNHVLVRKPSFLSGSKLSHGEALEHGPLLIVHEHDQRVMYRLCESGEKTLSSRRRSFSPFINCKGSAAERECLDHCSASFGKAILNRLGYNVRVSPDITVVTVVQKHLHSEFERARVTWRFGPEITAKVLYEGPKAVAPSGSGGSFKLRSKFSDQQRVIKEAVGLCQTEYLAFLPVHVWALPGAALFVDADLKDVDAMIHDESRSPTDWASVFGIFRSAALRRMMYSAGHTTLVSATEVIAHLRGTVGTTCLIVDLRKRGWRLVR